jgi:AraC-like DNA-binding protein
VKSGQFYAEAANLTNDPYRWYVWQSFGCCCTVACFMIGLINESERLKMPTTSSTLLRNIFFPAQLLEIGRSLWPEGGAHVVQTPILQLIEDYQQQRLHVIDGEQFRLAVEFFAERCQDMQINTFQSFLDSFSLADFGLCGLLMMTAKDLGSLLLVANEFQSVINPAYEFKIEANGQRLLLSLEPLIRFDPYQEFVTEMVVGVFTHVLSLLKVPVSQPIQLTLAHQPFMPIACYQDLPYIQIEFAASKNTVSFALIDLSIPLKTANQSTHHVVRQACLKQLSEPQYQLFCVSTQQVISHLLQEGVTVSVERVASELAVSVRTLSRRLQCEGVRFQRLYTDAVVQFAKQALRQTTQPIELIARRCGFESAASFARAFKRETGMSPMQYRRPQYKQALL